MKSSLAEKLQPENEPGGWSEKEAWDVKLARQKLTELIEEAREAERMDYENGFVSQDDETEFFRLIDETIQEADRIMEERNKSAEQAIAEINGLCEKIKSPGDIKREKLEKLADYASSNGTNTDDLIKKIEQVSMGEESPAEQAQTGTARTNKNISRPQKKKRGSGGFLRMRSRQ